MIDPKRICYYFHSDDGLLHKGTILTPNRINDDDYKIRIYWLERLGKIKFLPDNTYEVLEDINLVVQN